MRRTRIARALRPYREIVSSISNYPKVDINEYLDYIASEIVKYAEGIALPDGEDETQFACAIEVRGDYWVGDVTVFGDIYYTRNIGVRGYMHDDGYGMYSMHVEVGYIQMGDFVYTDGTEALVDMPCIQIINESIKQQLR